MILPLLDANGTPHNIDIEDVLIIKPTSRGPEFHTASGIYTFPTTTSELLSLFNAYHFQKVDRCSIINMDKAVRYDAKQRKVYFEEEPGTDSIYATVSQHNTGKFSHLIREDSASRNAYVSRSWISRLNHRPSGQA